MRRISNKVKTREMLIKDLLNPKDTCDKPRRHYYAQQHSIKALLEQVYVRYNHPNTVQLQNILKRYPSIPNITYLRSWFNNRHSKSKRDLNQVREQNIKIMRLQCTPVIFTKNMDSITLTTKCDSIEGIESYIEKLIELQTSCKTYLRLVHKLTIK